MQDIPDGTIGGQAVIAPDAAEPVARSGNYEPVRFNAMKHGILSRLAVLPHEGRAKFDDLLAAPIAEHRAADVAKQHRVAERATIIWRRRRVLLAEGAKINEGGKGAVSSPRAGDDGEVTPTGVMGMQCAGAHAQPPFDETNY